MCHSWITGQQSFFFKYSLEHNVTDMHSHSCSPAHTIHVLKLQCEMDFRFTQKLCIINFISFPFTCLSVGSAKYLWMCDNWKGETEAGMPTSKSWLKVFFLSLSLLQSQCHCSYSFKKTFGAHQIWSCLWPWGDETQIRIDVQMTCFTWNYSENLLLIQV